MKLSEYSERKEKKYPITAFFSRHLHYFCEHVVFDVTQNCMVFQFYLNFQTIRTRFLFLFRSRIFTKKFFERKKIFKLFKVRLTQTFAVCLFGSIKAKSTTGKRRNETESKCRIYLKREGKKRENVIDLRDFFGEINVKKDSANICTCNERLDLDNKEIES